MSFNQKTNKKQFHDFQDLPILTKEYYNNKKENIQFFFNRLLRFTLSFSNDNNNLRHESLVIY